MKLIIDIEPRYCKDMENDVKALYYEAINRITEAVRNGIPYEEKPQGEWIEHSCYKDVIICSNCNSGDSRWHKDFKFCPNCGAKMKGGAE